MDDTLPTDFNKLRSFWTNKENEILKTTDGYVTLVPPTKGQKEKHEEEANEKQTIGLRLDTDINKTQLHHGLRNKVDECQTDNFSTCQKMKSEHRMQEAYNEENDEENQSEPSESDQEDSNSGDFDYCFTKKIELFEKEVSVRRRNENFPSVWDNWTFKKRENLYQSIDDDQILEAGDRADKGVQVNLQPTQKVKEINGTPRSPEQEPELYQDSAEYASLRQAYKPRYTKDEELEGTVQKEHYTKSEKPVVMRRKIKEKQDQGQGGNPRRNSAKDMPLPAPPAEADHSRMAIYLDLTGSAKQTGKNVEMEPGRGSSKRVSVKDLPLPLEPGHNNVSDEQTIGEQTAEECSGSAAPPKGLSASPLYDNPEDLLKERPNTRLSPKTEYSSNVPEKTALQFIEEQESSMQLSFPTRAAVNDTESHDLNKSSPKEEIKESEKPHIVSLHEEHSKTFKASSSPNLTLDKLGKTPDCSQKRESRGRLAEPGHCQRRHTSAKTTADPSASSERHSGYSCPPFSNEFGHPSFAQFLHSSNSHFTGHRRNSARSQSPTQNVININNIHSENCHNVYNQYFIHLNISCPHPASNNRGSQHGRPGGPIFPFQSYHHS